jgi:hypothetical protein
MIYARIEAVPNRSSVEHERYAGAMVNCWIKQNDLEEAVSIARRIIAERGWHSENLDEARYCTREEFPEKGREYFDQALIDDEVLVFYTHPRDEKSEDA